MGITLEVRLLVSTRRLSGLLPQKKRVIPKVLKEKTPNKMDVQWRDESALGWEKGSKFFLLHYKQPAALIISKKKLEADFSYNSIIPLTSLFYGIKREVSCWVASPLYVVDREYRTCRCYNYFAPRFLSLVLCVVVGGLSDSDYYCIVPMTSSPLPHLRTNRSDIIPRAFIYSTTTSTYYHLNACVLVGESCWETTTGKKDVST